jgi:hypothetical protein
VAESVRQGGRDAAQGAQIDGPVIVDLRFRWPKGRNAYGDRDGLITQCKYLLDLLQKEGIIVNDRYLSFGAIEQERAVGQEEIELTIRTEAAL